MKLAKPFYIFLICTILLNIGLIYANNISKSNYNFFRIHVVANSDSIDDQLLKYTVSKKVHEYIKDITKDSKSKNESKEIISKNIQNILNLSNQIITKNNFTYDVKACIGKIKYEAKQMDNIHMPAGTYDSLKIIIGNGNGENWWSLIYPTSFSGMSKEEMLFDNTKHSFKIIEWLKELFDNNKAA